MNWEVLGYLYAQPDPGISRAAHQQCEPSFRWPDRVRQSPHLECECCAVFEVRKSERLARWVWMVEAPVSLLSAGTVNWENC